MFDFEDYPTEKRPANAARSNDHGVRIRFAAVAGLLALVTGLLLYSFFFGHKVVPDLVGCSIKDARALAADFTFKVKIEKEVYSSGFARGKVIAQRPKAGKLLNRGKTIAVIVSKGPKLPDISEKSVIVPNLIGLSVAEALHALEKEDLKGSYKEEYNEVVEKGIVVSQSVQAGDGSKAGSIIFFIVSLGQQAATTATTSPSSAANGKVICIDPGHQTKANLSMEPNGPGSTVMKEKARGGATGVSSGTPEYKITLQISLKLRVLLEKAGYTVVMTRETNDVDISNAERAKIANQANADLFVRIHCDSSDNSSTNGISTLYPAKNQWTGPIYARSLKAAQLVQAEVVKAVGRKDNGIVARGDMTGFNWSQVPAILVEVGFLSNPEEDRLLNMDEFQQKLAQGVYNGIIKYLQ